MGKPEQSITTQIKDTEKQKKIRRAVFLVYLAVTIKLIIFKYPWEHLKEIMDTWEKGIILEGLETANFTLFKTVRMYIIYHDRLNSFENLAGNVGIFVPFGCLLYTSRLMALLTASSYQEQMPRSRHNIFPADILS